MVAATSGIADPRVQHRVQQVHDQVREQVHDDQQADDPDHGRAVLQPDAVGQLVPDARDVEDPFGHHRAGHQVADRDTEEGDHRDQRVAQHVHAHHAQPGQSLGVGRLHVVGAQVLHDRRAGQPDGGGQRQRGEDGRGQQVLVQTRALLDGGVHDVPLYAEQVLQREAEHEHRYADDEQGQRQRGVVEDAAPTGAGQYASAQPEDDDYHQGQQRQPQGERPGLRENRADRPAVQLRTEVTVQQSVQVSQVPHQERVVQVVPGTELDAQRRADRPVPDQRLDRVAGAREHQRVYDERGTEEDQDHLQQPPHDETQHAVSSVPAS